MRQFDVVSLSDRSHALVLQSNLLESTNTVVVAPLIRSRLVTPVRVLHPHIRLGRHDYVVLTDKMSAVLRADIRRAVLALREREFEFRRALDMVFLGV